MRTNLLYLTSATVLAACGGEKITTTRIKPPVEESLPGSLVSGEGLTLTATDYTKTCQTDASAGDVCQDYDGAARLRCIVKNRLFCTGPTAVLSILDSLDSRLAEIETRSEEGDVTCTSGTAVDLSDKLTFPGDHNPTAKFKCKDSSINLGFGDDAGTWYVREAGGAGAQNFSITAEGLVDGYIVLPTFDGTFDQSTMLLRIRADREAGTAEITGGGVGIGFCAFHYMSNESNIYIYANPDGTGGSCDYNEDQSTNGDDWVAGCLDAATLDETEAATCADLKASSELATIGRAETTATGGMVSTWAGAPAKGDGSTLHTFEMNDYLNELFTNAKLLDGVAEFKTE